MLELLSCKKVWGRAEHNAFTDLCEFDGCLWLVFREGKAHISDEGIIVVLKSRDGSQWQLASEIRLPGEDLRDPKIIVTPDQGLMVTTVGVDRRADPVMQSYLYFSADGKTWSGPKSVGKQHEWIWRSRYIQDGCYGVSYNPGEQSTTLYKLDEQNNYQPWVQPLFSKETHQLGYPNEHDLFELDGNAMGCLLRRDADTATAQLGISAPPYTHWQWHDLGVQIGGPVVLRLNERLTLAALGLYQPVRTVICALDVQQPQLKELLVLPSDGDTSYPGLVFKDDILYCSYYSSHEDKSCIYLATLKMNAVSG